MDNKADVFLDLINSLDTMGKHKLIGIITESMVLDVEQVNQSELIRGKMDLMFKQRVRKDLEKTLKHHLIEK